MLRRPSGFATLVLKRPSEEKRSTNNCGFVGRTYNGSPPTAVASEGRDAVGLNQLASLPPDAISVNGCPEKQSPDICGSGPPPTVVASEPCADVGLNQLSARGPNAISVSSGTLWDTAGRLGCGRSPEAFGASGNPLDFLRNTDNGGVNHDGFGTLD